MSCRDNGVHGLALLCTPKRRSCIKFLAKLYLGVFDKIWFYSVFAVVGNGMIIIQLYSLAKSIAQSFVKVIFFVLTPTDTA